MNDKEFEPSENYWDLFEDEEPECDPLPDGLNCDLPEGCDQIFWVRGEDHYRQIDNKIRHKRKGI